MKKIYFYPKIDYHTIASPNPYIEDFEKALKAYYHIINKHFNHKGVLDFFQFLPFADVFLFNWIEDLPHYRFGKLQTAAFVFFLYVAKVFNSKIIWVLHNKYSHDVKKNRWTDFMFRLMMRRADLILTHSEEGIDFARENYPAYAQKVKYFVHPTKEPFPTESTLEKKYDFVLWGAIWPYKGIVPFLQFLQKAKIRPLLPILIVGRCMDSDYRKQLHAYASDRIIFDEKFYDIREIARFAAQSKFILFTHRPVSVLSSGALMDSIRMNTTIIGPNHGAFRDLSPLGFIKTYTSYEDIIGFLKRYDPTENGNQQKVANFCRTNNWTAFGQKLQMEINRILAPNE